MTTRRTPSRALRALAASAALAAVLAGCSAAEEEPGGAPAAGGGEPTAEPSPTDAPEAPEPLDDALDPGIEVGRYVAIGDSFTAGPFVPVTETETGCLRSSGNYPSLVAGVVEPDTFVDVSCSGADATAMIGAQRTTTGVVPAQFDAVTEETDLVTVGLGGNDFEVFSTLVAGCTQLAQRDPEGAPCRESQQQGGEDVLIAQVEQTAGRIEAVLRGVLDRAPDARVLLVGYPQLVPDEGACTDLLPLAEGDFAYVGEVNRELNDALRDAARAAGVEFVDVGAASEGHDICSDEPWVNGKVTDQQRALAYHPFPEGQRAVAELVLEQLAERPQGA